MLIIPGLCHEEKERKKGTVNRQFRYSIRNCGSARISVRSCIRRSELLREAWTNRHGPVTATLHPPHHDPTLPAHLGTAAPIQASFTIHVARKKKTSKQTNLPLLNILGILVQLIVLRLSHRFCSSPFCRWVWCWTSLFWKLGHSRSPPHSCLRITIRRPVLRRLCLTDSNQTRLSRRLLSEETIENHVFRNTILDELCA